MRRVLGENTISNFDPFLMLDEFDSVDPKELAERIEVRIEEDTVWLTQQQMATLFMQTKQNISLHINNCFKDNELQLISVVKDWWF